MQFLEDIKSYVGFDADDETRLEALKPVVSPHFEEVADRFYDSLVEHEHTRGVFDGPDQLERLKGSLHDWLNDVFSGPYDEQYYEHRRHIGRVHVDVGLKPHYMFAAMNLVRVELIAILAREPLDMKLVDAIGSVERILDIDLTIMLGGYWDAILSEKARADTDLATGLAHEIRNPLNSIGLNLTLLERKLSSVTEESANWTTSVGAIRTELERIEDLTKEIKQYSEPVTADGDWHDLDSLIDEMLSLQRANLDDRSIELEQTIDPDAAEIYCDAERLKQALKSIVQNAIEAIGEDGTITIKACVRNSHTLIEVTDDGIGMKPTATQRAFDLFYTTKASGTGIGLPIVKKAINAHGGSIDLISKSDHGTTVRVTLPRPEHPSVAND